MGAPAVLPNGENATQAELETAAQCAPTDKASKRFRAIIALLMGIEVSKVARLFGVTSRQLNRWVLAFNQGGIDALILRKSTGRKRKIPREKVQDLCGVLDAPHKAQQVHWTGVKFHGYLRQELQLQVGYTTVIRFLHEQNYRLKVPQPWPDRQNEEKRKQFVEKLRSLLQDPEVDLWFGDESGFEGDPRPRRRWAKKGEKTRVTKNGDHLRMNVCGAICPRRGEFYALEFSHTDRDTFQAFLTHANHDLTFERKRNILILDNASWHKVPELVLGGFELMFLPAYSPDLNPIEKLWRVLKAEWFTDFIAKNRKNLIARLDQALLWAMNRKEQNKQTCSIKTNI